MFFFCRFATGCLGFGWSLPPLGMYGRRTRVVALTDMAMGQNLRLTVVVNGFLVVF